MVEAEDVVVAIEVDDIADDDVGDDDVDVDCKVHVDHDDLDCKVLVDHDVDVDDDEAVLCCSLSSLVEDVVVSEVDVVDDLSS